MAPWKIEPRFPHIAPSGLGFPYQRHARPKKIGVQWAYIGLLVNLFGVQCALEAIQTHAHRERGGCSFSEMPPPPQVTKMKYNGL